MSTYTYIVCAPSGEPVGEALTAAEREVTFQVNGVHTAKLVLPLTDAMAGSLTPGVARLKVYRNRTAAELASDPSLTRELVFYGSLPPQNVREDAAADRIEAVFCDPRWVLAQRFTSPNGPTTPETYTSQDQGAILWGLVNTQNGRVGGDTFLQQGSTTTGITRTVTYDRRSVSDAFAEMVRFIDGPDVDVAPVDGWAVSGSRLMGSLNVYGRQGQDRPNATFTYGPTPGSNCRNMRREYREAVTQAQVIGTDSVNGSPLTDTYGYAASSAYGLLERYTSVPDVTSLAFLQFYARGIVEALKTPREVVVVEDATVEAPAPFIAYGLGDTVYVTCRKGSMVFTDRPLRVHGITIKVSQEGQEAVTLTTAEI